MNWNIKLADKTYLFQNVAFALLLEVLTFVKGQMANLRETVGG